MSSEQHNTQNDEEVSIDLCVVCKIAEARMMDHVCGYGRCLECFDKGSKITYPYCAKNKK